MSDPVLITDAIVYTAAGVGVSAVLIDDGLIQWLGQAHEAEQISGVRRISAGGNWLAPAFADAHVHITDTGLRLRGPELGSLTDPAGLGQAVGDNENSVVIAHGWDDTEWHRPPTSNDLPADAFVYASRVDSHSAVVSRPLMNAIADLESFSGFSDSGVVTADAHAAVRQWALAKVNHARTGCGHLRYLAARC